MKSTCIVSDGLTCKTTNLNVRDTYESESIRTLFETGRYCLKWTPLIACLEAVAAEPISQSGFSPPVYTTKIQ